MQDERKRILNLVEKGTITAQEALVLLEKLEQPAAQSVNTQKQNTTTEQSQFANSQSQSDSYTNEEDFTKQQDEKFKQNQSSRVDDTFFEDLKKDFTQFSTKFVDLMNTTLSKVKEFDFEKTFMDPTTFEKEEIIEVSDFKNISIDIPNGNIEIKPSFDGKAKAVYQVKPSFVKLNDNIEKEFEGQFVCKNDN